MHELSVCQSIIQQAEHIAAENNASAISHIALAIGPLAGVDINLLQHAFPLAAAGTLASNAELTAEALPLRIRCLSCFQESEVPLNRLLCLHCNDWHTQVISGDEMLIKSIELETEEDVNYV
jgi:hydrogenase nickel incorporation protein HypA/HybF